VGKIFGVDVCTRVRRWIEGETLSAKKKSYSRRGGLREQLSKALGDGEKAWKDMKGEKRHRCAVTAFGQEKAKESMADYFFVKRRGQ